MSIAISIERYMNHSSNLVKIVNDAEARITGEISDEFFIKNANFLTKSFLISLCCYLEAFLKEVANFHVKCAQQKISESKVPHNLIKWSLDKEFKKKDLEYKEFSINLSEKDIDDELSGNPFRTASCFEKLGIDLETIPEFKEKKEIINTVISKRNNIIHHNDNAANISLGDIKIYSAHFDIYVRSIGRAVEISMS